MKVWEMDIKATTHIQVSANTLEEALKETERLFTTLSFNEKVEWKNFAIITSSIGITAK